jgi:hypothetical protein
LSIFMMNANPSSKTYPANVSMTVSLRANNKTTGTPVKASLQSITLPGSSIPETGWLNITGFSLKLNPGETYWVVFSTGSRGAGFPMARLVSPYNLQVLVSLDNGLSWVNPGEGPTGFAFVAQFSDGEQLGNFIQGVPAVRVDGSNFFAQPFRESNANQAVGVFVGPIKAKTQDPNKFVVVSIDPSNGAGQPSGVALAEGVLYAGNITLNYGLQYIQFSSVARLEAGQEYWIVVRGLGGNFEVDPVVYSYRQQTQAPPMVSRDGGYSWAPYSNLTTILSYEVATPSTPLPTYSTAQLVSDLARFHDLSPEVSPAAGWNSYVKSTEVQRENNLTSWFRGFSGKPANFYGTSDQSILTNLDPSFFIAVASPGTVSTCQALTAYLLSVLPSGGEQLQVVENLKLLKSCFSPSTNNLIGQLNYARFLGPQFGLSTNANVLVLGATSDDMLARYLSLAYNVNYVDVQSNSPQALAAMKGSYMVVVLDAGTSIGAGLSSSLEKFASLGGTVVDLNHPSPVVSGCPASTQSLGDFQRRLDYWTRNTDYYKKLNVTVSNGSMVAGGLGATVTQAGCGLGGVITLDEGNQTALGQVSGETVVVSNIVANTFSPNSASPFWYGPAGSASPSPLLYGIAGNASGQLLLWVSNPGSVTEPFSISLNATYYGLPQAWKTIALATLTPSDGRGSPVSIEAQIPPSSWIPFYIVPDNASVRGDYSSVAVGSDLRYPNQMLVTAQGAPGQRALLVSTANQPVISVSSSGQTGLTRVSSASVLLTGQTGWYFDNNTHTLMVNWVVNSSSTLRMIYETMPSPSPPKPYPQTLFLILFSTLLAVELVVIAHLRSQKRSRQRDDRRGEGIPQAPKRRSRVE